MASFVQSLASHICFVSGWARKTLCGSTRVFTTKPSYPNPLDTPFVAQAVVDLLSHPERALPTLTVLDGLSHLLKTCPLRGLEGIMERVPIIADVVLSTLNAAAAAAVAHSDGPVLVLEKIGELLSITRLYCMQGRKSFGQAFAAALVERGLVPFLFRILAQGNDDGGGETSVISLFRALK